MEQIGGGVIVSNVSLKLMTIFASAIASDLFDEAPTSGNITTTTLDCVFISGSSAACVSIGIRSDGVVEGTEEFAVQLRADPQRDDVNITQDTTTVVILDSPNDSEW